MAPMSEGPGNPIQFRLGRLFLWVAIAGIWVASFVKAKHASFHRGPWFEALWVLIFCVFLLVGPYIERRVRILPEANKVELYFLWTGLALFITPIAYRILEFPLSWFAR